MLSSCQGEKRDGVELHTSYIQASAVCCLQKAGSAPVSCVAAGLTSGSKVLGWQQLSRHPRQPDRCYLFSHVAIMPDITLIPPQRCQRATECVGMGQRTPRPKNTQLLAPCKLHNTAHVFCALFPSRVRSMHCGNAGIDGRWHGAMLLPPARVFLRKLLTVAAVKWDTLDGHTWFLTGTQQPDHSGRD